MPFPQKYSAEVRAAATARALERRAKNPQDRRIFADVAEEFPVGQQSLRGWVAKASPHAGQRTKPARRPNFSPVVTTVVPQGNGQRAEQAQSPLGTPAGFTAEAAGSDVASLEEEVAELRRGNDALKAAMRVLLDI